MDTNDIMTNKTIFIQKANIKHDNIYDYSLVKYTKCRQKVDIICNIHGIVCTKNLVSI